MEKQYENILDSCSTGCNEASSSCLRLNRLLFETFIQTVFPEFPAFVFSVLWLVGIGNKQYNVIFIVVTTVQ